MPLNKILPLASGDLSQLLLGVGGPIALIVLFALSAIMRARLSDSLAPLKLTGQYSQWKRRNIVFIILERFSLVALLLAFALFLVFLFLDYEFSLAFFAAFIVAIPIHLGASFLLAARRPRHSVQGQPQ